MLRFLAKNNTGMRKSVMQSEGTVCRSSRVEKPVITSKNLIVYLSKRRSGFVTPNKSYCLGDLYDFH